MLGRRDKREVAALNKRILEVDGLRAIAMTMVIAQHCGLLPFGWMGVWLFYAISGYVITRGFLAEEGLGYGVRKRFATFMLRRFFRIVPVYALYIVINILLLLSLNNAAPLQDLPYLASFTFNWQMIFGYDPGTGTSTWGAFGHLWTLSVEEQFYLFFPIIALVAPVRARLPITVIFIIAGPIIRYFYAEAVAPLNNDAGWAAFSVYAASICHFDAFLLGSLIARFEPDFRSNQRFSDWAWAVATVCGVVYVAMYIGINLRTGATGINVFRNVISGIIYGQHREVLLYLIVNLLMGAVLIHAILRRPFSGLLASRVFALVGSISYGGYLFHALLLWAIKYFITGMPVREMPIPERAIYFSIAWIATIAVAYISFRWFETPIARWGRSRLASA